MNTPRVSVLVPSYNYATKIARCLESVFAQRYDSFELVVSDDASTDDSDAVIRSYRDSRLVYERQPVNLGMVPNWRRCVALSRGTYLLLLGADDYIKPDMLSRCAALMDQHPRVAFCHTATEWFTDNGRIVGTTGAFRRSYVGHGQDLLRDFILGARVVNSSALFRRNCYEELGGWTDAYRNCMDLDLWFRMLLRWDAAYIGDLLTGFRTHGTSTDWKLMQAEEDLEFLRSMFARLPASQAQLRQLEPALICALCTERHAFIQTLPPSPARDRVLARLARHADLRPVRRATTERRVRHALREWAFLRLARLPAPLRFRIGDIAAASASALGARA
jgi:glycosyltransferase involved in cell wall biosynthesis